MADTLGRPGWWVGPQGRPAEYRLRTLVYDSGLEGEVWRAESTDRGGTQRWAVKILSADRFAENRKANKVLGEWLQRWGETVRLTHSLESPEGLVLPAPVFAGPPPRPGPHSDTPAGSLLYMVSRWVEGGLTLRDWRRGEPDRGAWCDVLEQLCDLVGQLGAADMVHGDLSPMNVMLENGRVRLIDFTFMAPTGAAPIPRGGTRGYAAPEMPAGDRPVDPAIDRYAVGGLAYFLLMGDHRRDELWHVHRELRREYSEGLADRVAALLDPDPRERPRLRPWMGEVKRLVRHGIRAGAGHDDLALAVDGSETTEIVAVGAARIAAAKASDRRHPLLRDVDEPAPDAVRAVAVARRGNGDLAVFTRDALGRPAVRVDRRWRRPDPDLTLTGPLRAAAHGDGRASGFGVADDQLIQVEVALSGTVTPVRHCGDVRRVLAAATGPDGGTFVAVEDPFGQVHCGPPDGPRRTKLAGVDAVALCVNGHGEPVCVASSPGSAELDVIAHPGNPDLMDHRKVAGKPDVRDVAAVWLRTGLVLAIATGDGLWVKSEPGDWASLWPHPTTRVTLTVGYGWRVQVAALADGSVLYGKERDVNVWTAAKPIPPA